MADATRSLNCRGWVTGAPKLQYSQPVSVTFASTYRQGSLLATVCRLNIHADSALVFLRFSELMAHPSLSTKKHAAASIRPIEPGSSFFFFAQCWQGLSAEDGRTTVAKVHFVPLLYSQGLSSAER
jgi:hypothetical protein